ncbi:hypothetical protein ACFVAJ_18300 [Agromyces sp. NPDC057679]|uniref:hypothetical protein n=1 Tax=Agromyces sp. NPDC057679 TaxID=3346207 RepID=UPI00366E2FFC
MGAETTEETPDLEDSLEDGVERNQMDAVGLWSSFSEMNRLRWYLWAMLVTALGAIAWSIASYPEADSVFSPLYLAFGFTVMMAAISAFGLLEVKGAARSEPDTAQLVGSWRFWMRSSEQSEIRDRVREAYDAELSTLTFRQTLGRAATAELGIIIALVLLVAIRAVFGVDSGGDLLAPAIFTTLVLYKITSHLISWRFARPRAVAAVQ